MTFINLLIIYSVILLTTTTLRKSLTYKGIKLILLLNNFMVLTYCSFFWSNYVLNSTVELLSLKLNPNTWTGVIYELAFKVNSLSFFFIFLVVVIGSATNVYILNYFKYEEREEEFILLINWFILSMIILVCGNNFFTLILGWELIGLTSFLLINFWKFKAITLGCSFKAFSFNKFSDLLLMISFCSIWNLFQTNNIDTVMVLISYNLNFTNNALLFSAITLLVCSSVKSAQIIGHLWLPDSMEAPVPASSLIHSATLVSAGIFLILKLQIIFIVTNTLFILFVLGGITACYGGIIAASQSDVKRLLAYSTISHCGFIIASISFNNLIVTVVYLYLHGLYKAVTFFCVGSLIKYNNTQDTRMMGALKTQIVNMVTLLFVSANLGGLPFMFGYLYKQVFISSLVTLNFNTIGYGLCVIGMLTSPIYVFKLNYYSSFDFRKGYIQTVFLKLQNYKVNFKSIYVNFTYTKIFAYSLIYLYALVIFIVLKYFILINFIITNNTPYSNVNYLPLLETNILLKSTMIKVYYSLFVCVILILLLNKNRANYFYIQQFRLISYLISFILTLNIIFFLTKYLILILNYDKLSLYIINII